MTEGSSKSPSEQLDSDFTPVGGEEIPLTDTQAADALVAGDKAKFVKWMTQQHGEASRRPDSVLEYALQVRIALAYHHAARMVGRGNEQKKFHAEALSILADTNGAVMRELVELDRATPDEQSSPGHIERMEALRKLSQDIINLRTEITRP